MTIHYHGTPITPHQALLACRGRNFCVSYLAPQQVEDCHRLGQSVMLDNGAFSAWKRGVKIDWNTYFNWCEPWLYYQTTWAVIPDVITGSEADNDKLIRTWPFGKLQGAPVWHLHESMKRLLTLSNQGWARICFGSSAQYAEVGSKIWHRRVSEAFDELHDHHLKLPWIHMLRGMNLAGGPYPFASLDSTDVGRNHNRRSNPGEMIADWDARQCPAKWQPIRQRGFF